MDTADVKMPDIFSTEGLQKSAIIYRNDSASFIYVCFHCGHVFKEINETLQHIESHFQLANVFLDQFSDDYKKDNLDNCFAITSATDAVNIKLEVLHNGDASVSTKSEPMNQDDELKSQMPTTDEVSTVERSRKKPATLAYPSPYQCHKCSETYRTLSILKSHLRSHVKDNLLQTNKCKMCDCYYKNAYSLRMHVLAVHLNRKRFSCTVCDRKFNSSESKQFEKHLERHNGPDKQLWTNIRDGIYHQKVNFLKYEEIDSFTEQQWPCEFCTERFYLKNNLNSHIKSAHSGRRLQCEQCYSIFTTPKSYYAHQLEHQRVGRNIIESDDNVLLANLDAITDERIIYNSETSFSCAICNTEFEVQYDIRSHIRERHVYKMFPPPKEPRKEFICDICGVRLKSKGAIEKHLEIHTNTKSHGCSFCGKMFRLNSTKTIHERQHTGEKPYQCHECGKAFLSKGLLTAHKKCHEDTTYSCPICGKTFNLPSGYRNHVKTHRADRPFKCTICTKTFNTRIYLTRHMVIHSDKKYQCRFCESKFNTSDGRRQHHKHKHRHELM